MSSFSYVVVDNNVELHIWRNRLEHIENDRINRLTKEDLLGL